MTKVIITLDFDNEDVSQADVENYLNELMDDGSLSATVVDEDGEYVRDI